MFKRLVSRRKRDAKNSTDVGLDASHPASPGPSLISHVDSNVSQPVSQARSSTSTSGKSKDTEPGPLGLSVVYTPDNGHKVDIVFVHGLGGTSRWTWSKNRNPELFWPLTFLPLEPDICLARIMTFGYNASFQKSGNVATSVLDFAKDLLFDLKYAKDQQMEELDMGKVPLIFVVHSMGGLIVKEAYMQGQNDPEYEEIIKSISAITFLATPHRGTTLAQTLNRILDSVMLSNSKQYISDLMKNSLTLQKLNEQFRHIAPRLEIVSFYETLPTPVGLKSTRVMVLEKDSSVLGYPGEISKALNADHHDVCKYEGPQDPNYVTVRNILKSLVSKVISKNNARKPDLSDRKASLDLKALLGISDAPSMDYIFFQDQWTDGTNAWILEERSFREWRSFPGSTHHRLLWLNGGAATGKSVMSAFVVNALVEEGLWCQYFFFRYEDGKKRTLSMLIRSLAYQLALCVPGFLQSVVDLADEAIDFNTADPRIIWDRIFKSILFKSEDTQPLYWVVDGLDEAEDPRAVIKLLLDICSSTVPIRILFTSRRSSPITSAFERIPQTFEFEAIGIEGHLEDFRQHIRRELTISGSDEFRSEIEQRLIESSHSNFLWVRLAVDRVNQCYTRADVDTALRELPVGMEAIYNRMASAIEKNPNSRDRTLATRILEFVTCAVRVLKVAELSQALGEVTSEMLDLERTIMELCGDFVFIDNGGNVAMIHHTAHDYLLNSNSGEHRIRHAQIHRQNAHKQIFLSSMRCLMTTGIRAKLGRSQEPVFLEYAAGFWSSHLASASPHDQEIIVTLKKFLKGNWVLTWIHALAANGKLRVLIRASSDVSKFVSKRKQKYPGESINAMPFLEQELLESWAIDFLRIVGKFSNLLRRKPDSIYKLIPTFCPKRSSVYQQFGTAEAENLSVTGLSAETWDDSLARISLGQGLGTFASSISAAGSQIAVLASSGSAFLYDSSDFMEAGTSPLKHGERVDRMQLDRTATFLATYGYRTTKVWEVATGRCKVSVDSVESKTRPLVMHFTQNKSKLLVGTADRKIRSLDLDSPQPEWEIVAELDDTELEGQYMLMNSASHMALSQDGSMVAIAYRSHPLSAWETDGPVHVGHCWRKNQAVAIRELRELVWHPHLPRILGLNIEGIVFKWAPYEGEIDELPVGATKMAVSRDGDLFATGDGHGRVKIYTTSTFSLLYQLAAQDTVLGLAFSPDSRRLYDLRGYYANAWEPDVLMRLAEQSHRHLDSGSESHSVSQVSETSVVMSRAVDSITALAGSPRGRIYCCGTERGVVSIYDTTRGKLSDIYVSRARFTIEKIIWSTDGKYVCFTDMSKQLIVFSVTYGPGEAEPIVAQKTIIPLRKAVNGTILQLLFQSDSSRLFVHGSSQICTISLESPSVEGSRELEDSKLQWIEHPTDSTLIVGIGYNNMYVFDWKLVEHRRFRLSCPQDMSSNNTESTDEGETRNIAANQIDRLLVTRDREHIFIQYSPSASNSRGKRFYFLKTSSLRGLTPPHNSPSARYTYNESSQPSVLTLSPLEADLSSKISVAFSFLFRDRLVFLSRNFTVCSVPISWNSSSLSLPPKSRESTATATQRTAIGAGRQSAGGALEDKIQEFFALPGDWISRDSLSVCAIWRTERSLLYPRNGEVAVVKCAALA